jgi:cell wall-associated NlpC family hydrolase
MTLVGVIDGNPVSHVAIYVGDGKGIVTHHRRYNCSFGVLLTAIVVTHGHDPVEYTVVHYRSDYHSTRSYL